MRNKIELSAQEVIDMLVNEAYKKGIIPTVKSGEEWRALNISTKLAFKDGEFSAEISWEAK